MIGSKRVKTENKGKIRWKRLSILTAEEKKKKAHLFLAELDIFPVYGVSSIHPQTVRFFLGDVLEDTVTMSCYLHNLVVTFLFREDEGLWEI